MSQNAALESEAFKANLYQFFRETFEQVSGIYLDRNTSLFDTLATISAEEASIPVSASCATLAAQVEHIRFYIDVMEQYFLGTPPTNTDWNHIWNTVSAVTPEEWDASKARLRASHDRFLERIKTLETWETEDHVGIPIAILVHTAYHLGEIRQALCTIKQR
jgi:hypothetical protein